MKKIWLTGLLLAGLSSVATAIAAPLRITPTAKPLLKGTHLVQYGIASWYGGRDQGHLMACGEPFDQYALTAAHRTLPLGTEVRVTNLHNGRSVRVRIKDRGPMIPGRLIDLSRGAATRLGFVHGGLAPVRVQVVSLPPADLSRTVHVQIPPRPYS
jgi:rare lipoprotein A